MKHIVNQLRQQVKNDKAKLAKVAEKEGYYCIVGKVHLLYSAITTIFQTNYDGDLPKSQIIDKHHTIGFYHISDRLKNYIDDALFVKEDALDILKHCPSGFKLLYVGKYRNRVAATKALNHYFKTYSKNKVANQ